MQKGDLLITRKVQSVYQIVGRWDGEIVLANINDDSDEVLVYGPSELENLISEGRFRKLYKIGKE